MNRSRVLYPAVFLAIIIALGLWGSLQARPWTSPTDVGAPGDSIIAPTDLPPARVSGRAYFESPPRSRVGAAPSLRLDSAGLAPANLVPAPGIDIQVKDIEGVLVGRTVTGDDGSYTVADLPFGFLKVEGRVDRTSGKADAEADLTAYPEADVVLGTDYPVSRQAAIDQVLSLEDLSPYARVTVTGQPLSTGTIVYPQGGELGSDGPVYPVTRELTGPEWFFLIDKQPYAGYAHPVEYVFVSAADGTLTRIEDLYWWPLVNHGSLWARERMMYTYENMDWETFENGGPIPTEAVAAPTSEVVQAPLPPLPPDGEAMHRRLEELVGQAHNTDPDSLFIIIWQAAGESYKKHDASKMIDLFVNKGRVNYETNIRWIVSHRDAVRDPEGGTLDAGKSAYNAALTEFNTRIAERLAEGLHSTLFVYIVSHAGPGAFASYNTKDNQGGAYIYPETLKLTTTLACRVRVFLEFCFAKSFADPLAAEFNGLPPEKRHDYQIYSACGTDELSWAVPAEVSLLTGFNLSAGGRFTTNLLKYAGIGGGDVTGLLNGAGDNVRSDLESLFGTPDPFAQNNWQHPDAIVAANDPDFCQEGYIPTTTSVIPTTTSTTTTTTLPPDGGPDVTVTPEEINFEHNVGATGCPQTVGTITIRNNGSNPITWSAVSKHSAIRVSLNLGTLDPGEAKILTVVFDCSTRESIDTTIEVGATDNQTDARTTKSIPVKGTIG